MADDATSLKTTVDDTDPKTFEAESDTENGLICRIDGGCTFDRKDLGPRKAAMIRCILCMEWFHFKCVKLDQKSTIFSCLECRKMPAQITDMERSVKTVIKKQNRKIQELEEKLKEKESQCEDLSLQNANLRVKLASLDAQMKATVWANYRPEAGEQDLVVSDSMMRDIDSGKLLNTKVHCHGGAGVDTLIADLDTLAKSTPYRNAILMVGTNDISSPECATVDGIVEKFKTLIGKAKTLARQVKVSSICPRIDNAKEKVGLLNAGLIALCEETEDCTFVDHTPSFTLLDGSINDGYLIGDGPHLTRAGSNKVAHNLGLRVKPGTKDVTKQTGRGKPQEKWENRQDGDKQHSRGQRDNYSHNKYRDNRGAQRGSNRWQQSRDHTHTRSSDLSYLQYADYTNRCHYCYEEGHSKSRCRHNGPIQCHTCGYSGHKSKHCTN